MVSGRGGKKNRVREEKGGKFKAARREWHRGVYLKK